MQSGPILWPGSRLRYGLQAHATGLGQHGWTKSVLYNFKGFPDGAYPKGASSRMKRVIYGTTWQGGTGRCPDANGLVAGCGLVFKLTPAPDETWTESVLYSFETGSLQGEHPIGGLVADPDGNLFGVTLMGAISSAPCSIRLRRLPATVGEVVCTRRR